MAGESGGEETIERTVQAILGDLVLAEDKIEALKSFIKGLPSESPIPLEGPITIPLRGCRGVKVKTHCGEKPGLISLQELNEVLAEAESQLQQTRDALTRLSEGRTFKVDVLR
jgi:hypothetical protein